MQRLKLNRKFIISLLKEAIPEYEEMLASIEENGGWVGQLPNITALVDKLDIHGYPALYRSDELIIKVLLSAFMPVEQINRLVVQLENRPAQDQAQFTENLIKSLSDSANKALESFPDTPEKLQAEQKTFGEPTAEDQAKTKRQAQIMMGAMLALFYNTVSMMVHGRTLTNLVRTAEGGNVNAFFLAVQIDKRILMALPYFKGRHENAIANGETDFLNKLHYRLTSPLLRSKIRYKTLWLTFAILDVSGHLDGSLKHREILDICEKAGVGGDQNGIEDIGYLSKRLREYREFQKLNQMSTH